MKIEGLRISTGEFQLETGEKGKIAVFLCTDSGWISGREPRAVLDLGVQEYVKDKGYYELVDSEMNNPYMRVVISNINDMVQEDFDTEKHYL